MEIIKPKNEQRDIKYYKLENGIRCSLISDPDIDKSYVVVCINIGSLANKQYLDGLAHLLEHMCFITSKKYKEPNYLQSKMMEFGGSSNAYTSAHETVYYFDIFSNHLEEIIEIFVDFLFNAELKEEYILKEMKNVDSEHNKNLNNDLWRLFNIQHLLSPKDSNNNSFFTGSLETLKKPDVHKQIVEFYKKFYTSENISVSIGSNYDNKKIYNIVNKWFGSIPHQKSINIYIDKPLYKNRLDRTYVVNSVNDSFNLKYIYEIPNSLYELKPINYIYDLISYMFNINSEGAIRDFLKLENLIVGINSYYEKKEGIFNIDIELTSHGYNNMNLIDGYIKYYFEYIFNNIDFDILSDYIKQITNFNFDNDSKTECSDLANELAVNMFIYEPKYIYGNYIETSHLNNVNINEIKHVLSKSLKLVSLNKFNFENSKLKIKTDPYYKTTFARVKNIDGQPKKFNIKFDFENPYLKSVPKFINNLTQKIPIEIKKNIWFGNSSQFDEPLYYISFIFNNEKYFKTPKEYLLTSISSTLLQYWINKKLDKSGHINYSTGISLSPYKNNITIDMTLLNDIKISQLYINNIFNELFSKIDFPVDFIKNKIKTFKKELKNIIFTSPWDLVDYYFSLSYSTKYIYSDLLKEIKNINHDDIISWINTFFDDSKLNIYIYGNIKEIPNFNILTKYLNNNWSKPKYTLTKDIIITHPNINEKNNCIKIMYWISKFEPINVLYLILTYIIFSDLFFNRLRTEQQLGYLVGLAHGVDNDQYYIYQKVQTTFDTNLVQERINEFNLSIIDELKKINLNKWVETLKKHLLKKEESLSDYYSKYYNEIVKQTYNFNRNEILLQNINKINILDFEKWINKYLIHNKNKTIIITKCK